MEKIHATKMKMTSIWKGDDVIAVSPLKLTDESKVEVFKEGDNVKISGLIKGKGFQGVVKRYSFAGGPKTHGQKNRYRAPGSIGNTSPQRVVPGRKMAGRMGGNKKTIRNLTVVSVDKDQSTIMVKGSVPGTVKGKLVIVKD